MGQELRSLAFAGVPSTQLYGSDLEAAFLSNSFQLFNDRDSFKAQLVPADVFSSTLWEKQWKGWEGTFDAVHTGLFLHMFTRERQLLVCEQIVKLLKPPKRKQEAKPDIGEKGEAEKKEEAAKNEQVEKKEEAERKEGIDKEEVENRGELEKKMGALHVGDKDSERIVFMGENIGYEGGGNRATGSRRADGTEHIVFLHDAESFKKLWDEVAERTGTVGQWDVRARFSSKVALAKSAASFFQGEGVGWLVFTVERI